MSPGDERHALVRCYWAQMADHKTQITLSDGTVRDLSLAMLRSTLAAGYQAVGNLRAFALEGQRVELLSLIETALGVEPGAVSAREADQVGWAFELPIIPEARSKPVTPAPYELRSALARLAGQWVAVVDDKVIASAATLKELFEATDGLEATVAFVPEPADRRSE